MYATGRGVDSGAFTNNNGSNGTANVNALRPGVVSQDKCLSWGPDGEAGLSARDSPTTRQQPFAV